MSTPCCYCSAGLGCTGCGWAGAAAWQPATLRLAHHLPTLPHPPAASVKHHEFDRLRDGAGRASGMIGWEPSNSVTFVVRTCCGRGQELTWS